MSIPAINKVFTFRKLFFCLRNKIINGNNKTPEIPTKENPSSVPPGESISGAICDHEKFKGGEGSMMEARVDRNVPKPSEVVFETIVPPVAHKTSTVSDSGMTISIRLGKYL
jgi:hypothetical protein